MTIKCEIKCYIHIIYLLIHDNKFALYKQKLIIRIILITKVILSRKVRFIYH
jgi:hypothetical protein